MSTPLLPEVVPEIDANPVSFYLGRSLGHDLELPYVKFKVTITEFAYKSGRQFEENIRHSTVIASSIAYTLQRYWRVSVWTVCIMTYLLTICAYLLFSF